MRVRFSLPVPLRRLAALAYDLFLLLCLCLCITVILIIARQGTAIPPATLWYQLLLVFILHAYFIGFWCWGKGQTIGLKAWQLRLGPGPIGFWTAVGYLYLRPFSRIKVGRDAQ